MANLNHQVVQLTAPRISSKQKKMEFKMKIKTLDSDEGIKIDSGRGTKIYLNRRPSGSYVVEIVGEKNSDIEHPSENIRRITTSKNSAYFARDIDTSIVETARSLPSSD